MSSEVIGIDHIYIAVSDMKRSEAFYDRAMTALGFRKSSFAIGGDPRRPRSPTWKAPIGAVSNGLRDPASCEA